MRCMIKNYLFSIFLFFTIHLVKSQNSLVINLEGENKEIIDYITAKGFTTKPFYNISEDKFLELERDAIKITGTNSNVKKLKNYFTVSNFNQELLTFLSSRKVPYLFTENRIIPPPGDILPVTPSYVSQQTYLQANPGLNAEAVWNLGYSGQNVTIHNIEYGFNKNHEEFNDANCNIAPGMDVNTGASISYTEHGTATMGVLFGNNGSYGITGIAHGAQQVWLYPEWQQSGYSRTNAITQALNNSVIGDVIVFEMQAYGFNGAVSDPRFVPAEYDILVWNLTKALTDAGRIVVAAAGNGFQNLDSLDYQNYLNYGDSGAIIVGAGTANLSHSIYSYVSGGITYGSSYGARVDVQGWFLNVRTTGAIPGYGALLFNNDFNQSYMSFIGTSAATAQIGGVVSVLQSYYKSQTNNTLTSQQMRTILKSTGVAQGGDLTKNIGPIPNMLAALNNIEQNLSSESFEENNIVVYPNPSKEIFNLITGKNEISEIKVYDVLGKVVWSKKDFEVSNSEIQLNLSSVSSGVYFLRITSHNKSVVRRIIKE
ncbi:putative secreted protein (Por secretion system target) [Flavobacterium aquaticum]|uniref:Putative secreted protein (Por secretion system target) n=2 Tax=Flavobacterium aquaticum TaxID=1236486 RepID=A0A327YQY3_9FLAO|nr:putative secreted protein (Por secretion system target) [Flavobacterium aquaticum]